MRFYYPFRSVWIRRLRTLKEGQDYFIWPSDARQKVAAHIQSCKDPLVEVGGPTDTGFFFVDATPLPSRVEITNISSNPVPYDPKSVQLARLVAKVFDATKMPYADSSVGAFLMASMSFASTWWAELNEEQKEQASPTFEQEFARARLEMQQVAAGVLQPQEVTQAQRVKIYLEMHRALKDQGLLFADGTMEDIAILKRMGFELVALLAVQEEGAFAYEFVMIKKDPKRKIEP